jgi:ribonuclease BN (tRNA processing enzyme)
VTSRSELTLTVVGSAAAWTRGPGQPSSCYLVEHDNDAIVLDLGQGSLGALHGYREPSSLRAVFISHLHPDHHVDLVALRHMLRYGYQQERQIALHPPGELRSRYDAFLGEPGFLDSLPGDDLAAGTRSVGSLEVEIAPVMHDLNSHAFRVSVAGEPGSRGLVYSGDCGRANDLLPLVRPGDTLLCEALWGVEPAPVDGVHLTASEAARVAHERHAQALLLTHVAPEGDPQRSLRLAGETFSGSMSLATPGLRVRVT